MNTVSLGNVRRVFRERLNPEIAHLGVIHG